jgi:hypothetical protein
VAARYLVDGWRPVTVNFRSVPKSELAPGELSAVRIAGSAAGQTFRLTVERDPKRAQEVLDMSLKPLLRPGGEDEAGIELASRRAESHRKNHEVLETPPIGSPAEEVRPKHSVVFTRERRRADSAQVLLTMIQIGEGRPLRHVQRIDSEEEFALLLDVLSGGTHDPVFVRSLMAASDLVRAF